MTGSAPLSDLAAGAPPTSRHPHLTPFDPPEISALRMMGRYAEADAMAAELRSKHGPSTGS